VYNQSIDNVMTGILGKFSLRKASRRFDGFSPDYIETVSLALLHNQPSSGTTATRHERRRETTLWVLGGTFPVREPEDRFLRFVYCSRVIRRDPLLLGTVNSPPRCNPPASLTLASWLFQHLNFGNIASLEPPTHPPKNAVACIDMENRVVLGGDIAKDVRVRARLQPNSTLITTPRLYMLAAMSLNLWILLVIVRQKVRPF